MVLLVLGAPLLLELSGLDHLVDLLHSVDGLVGDDEVPAGESTVLGGVGADVPHVGHTALDDEVDDELALVAALEVCDDRGEALLDEGVESFLDELGETSALDGLLAEQVGFGLLVEVVDGEGSGAGAAHSLCEGEGDFLGLSAVVLVDGDEGGDSESLDELLPLRVSGGLGCHHDDIDVLGGNDELVGDGESVGELEGCSGFEVVLDVLVVDLGLDLVGQEHHDDVSLGGGLVHGGDLHSAVFLCLVPGCSVLPDSDDDVESGVAETESLCAALCTVSENCDLLAFQDSEVGILVVVDFHVHGNYLGGAITDRVYRILSAYARVRDRDNCTPDSWLQTRNLEKRTTPPTRPREAKIDRVRARAGNLS